MRNDKRDGIKVERDHPQTRKGEPDARGSAAYRDDVVPAEGEEERDREAGSDQLDAGDGEQSDAGADAELSQDEAEAVRRHGQGFRTMGDAVGGGAGLDVGSGTSADKGDLGGGGSGGGRG